MSPAPLVVLHSLRPPRASTGYVDLALATAAQGSRVRFFTWPTALLGRYDVLHVHWPELLVRDSRRPWLRVVRRRLLDLLMLRLLITRTPLVWTAHNLAPHESGPPGERRSLDRLVRRVDLVVNLCAPDDPAEPAAGAGAVAGPRDAESVTIAHAHYRDLYARHPRRTTEPGRLLHFGILRPYKGVPSLLASFAGLTGPAHAGARLSVVGHPHRGQAEPVERAAAADPRITATLAYVDDAVLVDEISRAQLVVLPYRGRMHNSGALLAALSLDRPVLVPRSPANEALAREAGAGWVLQYDGELTTDALARALAATARPPAQRPRLDARGGPAQRASYRDAYDRALEVVRGRTTPSVATTATTATTAAPVGPPARRGTPAGRS